MADSEKGRHRKTQFLKSKLGQEPSDNFFVAKQGERIKQGDRIGRILAHWVIVYVVKHFGN
jgi:hypothetical protein